MLDVGTGTRRGTRPFSGNAAACYVSASRRIEMLPKVMLTKRQMDNRLKKLRLRSGSRIAIIGGGPAGSFFAHFALKLAKQQGLDITVTIFDGKNFLLQGPPGCNMCAGVISETLLARLEKEEIQLPEERVQRRIDGYHLRTKDFGLHLPHPRGSKGAIRTVYRGNGPRFWPKTTDISFDDYLLSHVKREGAQVIEEVITDIALPTDNSQPVRLLCGGPGSQTECEADLVVGAFGLNATILKKVAALGFGYRPPRSVRAFQAELKLEGDRIRRQMGNNIYIFTLGLSRIRFAAFTPKKEHITVSVIGFEDVDMPDLRELLSQPLVRWLLLEDDILTSPHCRCWPRIAITPARKPFTDRFVLVGDACCSRYFKNGIESAFVSAELAAEAAFNSGISESAFSKDYYRKAKRTIIRDNTYGRLLFKAYDVVTRHRLLAQSYYRLARSDRRDDPISQLARQILWDVFTGNVTYRAIFFRLLGVRLQARLIYITLGLVVDRIRSLILGISQSQARADESQESKG